MTDPKPSDSTGRNDTWRTLAEFSVPSEPGNERTAMEVVAERDKGRGLDGAAPGATQDRRGRGDDERHGAR